MRYRVAVAIISVSLEWTTRRAVGRKSKGGIRTGETRAVSVTMLQKTAERRSLIRVSSCTVCSFLDV